jgi:hypothetical protein
MFGPPQELALNERIRKEYKILRRTLKAKLIHSVDGSIYVAKEPQRVLIYDKISY